MNNSYQAATSMGEMIAASRREKGLTLKQMGERLGVSAQAVHKWERGVNYPDITLIPMIARVLEIPIQKLFGE